MKSSLITGAARPVTDAVERAMSVLKDRAEPRPRAKPAGRRWQDREATPAKREADEA